jgi:hypothetical protein
MAVLASVAVAIGKRIAEEEVALDRTATPADLAGDLVVLGIDAPEHALRHAPIPGGD